MKDNLRHFSHDADLYDDPRFHLLRASPWGWAGEGRYWALCGMIAQAEDCRLDLSKKFTRATIATRLDLGMDELEDFLVYLRDDAELIAFEEGILTRPEIQEDLERAHKSREKTEKWRTKKPEEGGEQSMRGHNIEMRRHIPEKYRHTPEKYRHTPTEREREERDKGGALATPPLSLSLLRKEEDARVYKAASVVVDKPVDNLDTSSQSPKVGNVPQMSQSVGRLFETLKLEYVDTG
jgi:hypothetical protein